jgi:hypothetical protein
MCNEPKAGLLDLVAANDTQCKATGDCTVIDLTTDEIVWSGAFEVEENGKTTIAKIPEKKNAFYLIRWTSAAGDGTNHFVCTIGDDWTWEGYKACMQKAGFYNEFEGF